MQKRLSTSFQAIMFIGLLASATYAQPVQYTVVPPTRTAFKEVRNFAFFRVDDQLWRADGTEEGTLFLKDLNGRSLPFLMEST